MNNRLDRRISQPRALLWLMALAITAVLSRPAAAVTHLKRGDNAPAIVLKDLNGADVSTEKLKGNTIILVFGELYHDKTRKAYDQIDGILHDTRFKDESIVPLMITSQQVRAEDLRDYAGQKLPGAILPDPARQAFAAYEVAALPSVVVIDKQGRVVHAMAGLTWRFADILTDSLLLAIGKLSPERFEESLNPQTSALSAEATNEVRAGRMSLLGRQLARRGLDEMAVEKYNEALKLDSHNPTARLELGMLLLKHRRLSDAEKQFRDVLASQPASVQGALGLAFVQAQRGGAETAEAERTVTALLARYPSEPRAHFLMGMIHELRGRGSDAASSYKKAAQLLMERSQEE